MTWKESFETKTSAWSRTISGGLSEQSWYWTTEKPYGQDFTYATGGDANLWGDEPGQQGLATFTMTSSIPIVKSSTSPSTTPSPSPASAARCTARRSSSTAAGCSTAPTTATPGRTPRRS
ncbi:MAG: hypothetical protein U0S36_13680 [Candidatus Nanopelagicales bacterium]